jgi:hypothetical protein
MWVGEEYQVLIYDVILFRPLFTWARSANPISLINKERFGLSCVRFNIRSITPWDHQNHRTIMGMLIHRLVEQICFPHAFFKHQKHYLDLIAVFGLTPNPLYLIVVKWFGG